MNLKTLLSNSETLMKLHRVSKLDHTSRIRNISIIRGIRDTNTDPHPTFFIISKNRHRIEEWLI